MTPLKEQFLDARARLEVLALERDKLRELQKSKPADFDSSRLRQVFHEITALQKAQLKIIQSLSPDELEELFAPPDLPQQTWSPPSFHRWFFNTLNAEIEAAQADKESGKDKLPLWHGVQFKFAIILTTLTFLALVGALLVD